MFLRVQHRGDVLRHLHSHLLLKIGDAFVSVVKQRTDIGAQESGHNPIRFDFLPISQVTICYASVSHKPALHLHPVVSLHASREELRQFHPDGGSDCPCRYKLPQARGLNLMPRGNLGRRKYRRLSGDELPTDVNTP